MSTVKSHKEMAIVLYLVLLVNVRYNETQYKQNTHNKHYTNFTSKSLALELNKKIEKVTKDTKIKEMKTFKELEMKRLKEIDSRIS